LLTYENYKLYEGSEQQITDKTGGQGIQIKIQHDPALQKACIENMYHEILYYEPYLYTGSPYYMWQWDPKDIFGSQL
jgi:hypothetical protein